MHIKKIRLQSIRNHADSTLDLSDAKFVVIRGVMGAGKSSIAQGLSLNVAQSTMDLSADGKGFVSKIKRGESKGTITAEIQGKHLIRNAVTLDAVKSERSSYVECLDNPDEKGIIIGFANFLKAKREPLLVATNTQYLMSVKDEATLKNILAKLVLPAHHDFPEDKIAAVNSALGTGIVDFSGEPFGIIEKAYKLLYKERETINRQVKEFVVPDPLPAVQGVDSAALQIKLNQAREERQKLSNDKDEAVRKANEIEVKRTRLQTRIEGLQTKITDETNRLKTAGDNILSDAKLKSLAKIAEGKDALIKLERERTILSSTIEDNKKQMDRFEALPDAGTTCPTCDQVIDGNKLSQMAVKAEIDFRNAQQRDNEILRQMHELGDVAGALSSLAKHETAIKEKAAIESILAEKSKLLKADRTELDALGMQQDATQAFIQPLADVDTKINAILSQLQPVIAAEQRKTEIATKTEQLKKLQVKAASLNSLVVYFDKDGVKKDLIDDNIGQFEDDINEVLGVCGYETTLCMEPFSFEVKTPTADFGPMKELSKAERQLFLPAFQCAVSIAAGINLVVVDDMDTYLKETGLRGKIYGKLYELISKGLLEQVIMIEASSDDKLPNPQAPGSCYFFVEGGTVRRLG